MCGLVLSCWNKQRRPWIKRPLDGSIRGPLRCGQQSLCHHRRDQESSTLRLIKTSSIQQHVCCSTTPLNKTLVLVTSQQVVDLRGHYEMDKWDTTFPLCPNFGWELFMLNCFRRNIFFFQCDSRYFVFNWKQVEMDAFTLNLLIFNGICRFLLPAFTYVRWLMTDPLTY